MKRIDSVRALEEYGIVPLTGESDAHMYRLLCDITKRGKAIIERTMDVRLSLHDNWNGGSRDDPHIGSILLPLEFVPSIAVFCLLTDSSVSEVWLLQCGSVLGLGVEDIDRKESLRRHHDGEIRKVFYPRSQDRNVHQMTGRTS